MSGWRKGGPALDTAAIARRLQQRLGMHDRKSKIYVALTQARTDVADLLREVQRQSEALVELSVLFTDRIARHERNGQPMNPSGGALQDSPSAPHGLAQTTTASGAGPSSGARKPDHDLTPDF